MVIRDMSAADCDTVAALWHAGWHEAHANIVPEALVQLRTPESFRTRVSELIATTRVADDAEGVCGFVMTRKNELYQLYVTGRARGTGTARALLSDAEARLAVSGINTAWLACAIGNCRAERFYEKSGWSSKGRETVDLDLVDGLFPLEIHRFEKALSSG